MIPCDVCVAKGGIWPAEGSSYTLRGQQVCINLLLTDIKKKKKKTFEVKNLKIWPVFSSQTGFWICTGQLHITIHPFWGLLWRTEQVLPLPHNAYYLPRRVCTGKLLENYKSERNPPFFFHSLKALKMTFTGCNRNPLLMCLVLDRWWGSSAQGLRDWANLELLMSSEDAHAFEIVGGTVYH